MSLRALGVAPDLESFSQPLSSLGLSLPGYKGDLLRGRCPRLSTQGHQQLNLGPPPRGCQGRFPGTRVLGRFQALRTAHPGCCQ